MDLILIRHPPVSIDAGVCYGQTDVPLRGDVGESARALGERLRAMNAPKNEGVWHTSPLMRCRLLAEAMGPILIDARLRELNFGTWEQRPWDVIDRGEIDAWAEDLEHFRAHGGESVAQFAERIDEWEKECVARQKENHAVHVVTHAGVIRVLVANLLGISKEKTIQWPIDFGAVVWLRRSREGWTLTKWNA